MRQTAADNDRSIYTELIADPVCLRMRQPLLPAVFALPSRTSAAALLRVACAAAENAPYPARHRRYPPDFIPVLA